MRCNVCNTELEPNVKFCSNCGSVVSTDQTDQNGSMNQQSQSAEHWYDNNNRVFNPQTGMYTTPNKEMPMKWYKFLIYFSLYLAAIMNCINGIRVLTGSQYTYNGMNSSKAVYAYFSGLQAVDIVYGILVIALSMFGMITRQKLKVFSKQGPKYITVLYSATIGVSLFYLLTVITITELKLVDLLTTSFVTSIITAVIMIFVNRIYFAKREHLFVN